MISKNEKYSPDSPILIFIIDAFHKIRDNESKEYDPSAGIISSQISDENKQKIQGNRKIIYDYLKNNEIKWRDCEEELSINIDLKFGKDFFGNDTEALYLPAIFRFWGDFYEGLGNDGRIELLNSPHHILILSALYGFLKPFEAIQYYACQFGDKNLAYDIWTKDHGISQILTDYIKKYNIKRIFDFTSSEVVAYHECINWDYVKRATNGEVLHCYHRYAKRDQALKPFGVFVKSQLLSKSSENLLAIKPDSSIGDVKFSSSIKLSESETLRRLIENGENDKVEFKSGALWSVNLTPTDIKSSTSVEIKKYEKNASKFILARSIASFLNANGGELIIGIREDRINNITQKTGIEEEYQKLREKDRNPDGYRRMIIYSIMKKYIPDIFEDLSNFIQISFDKISGKTLCWLHIKPAVKPIFVEIAGEEIFFKRVDASTQLLSGKALTHYVLNRFFQKKNV